MKKLLFYLFWIFSCFSVFAFEERAFLPISEFPKDIRLVMYFDAERNCFVREKYAEDRECTQEELDAASTVIDARSFLDLQEIKKLKNEGRLPFVFVKPEPMYDNVLVDFICDEVWYRYECEKFINVYSVFLGTGVALSVIPVTAPAGISILGVTSFVGFTGWAFVRFFPSCTDDPFCEQTQIVFGVR